MQLSKKHTISYLPNAANSSLRQIVYQGALSSPRLRLHYGFDGWQGPIHNVKLQQITSGLAMTEPLELGGHLSLDCVVTNGQCWDNNHGADYRLWIDFAPLDAHLHVSGEGSGELGLRSLETAMASVGISQGIVSWIDNAALDRIQWRTAGLSPLVWVRPGETSVDEVRTRLAAGFVGLKLHPVVDEYRADDLLLNPYLEVATEYGCPVACHSAPGKADPDHIRRLAERFPMIPVILYHTYLGPQEGRRRAAEHAREQSNLYLETSWCRWQEITELIESVGAERVLFGSDAAVDGAHHYCRHPPNVKGQETYKEGLVALMQALGSQATRQVMGDNAKRLFHLN